MSNKEIVYWKDAKGKSIDVMSMDLNYCRNVLKMIITGNTQSGKSFDINKHISKQIPDIDHHEFESDLGFDFNSLPESMNYGNNDLSFDATECDIY